MQTGPPGLAWPGLAPVSLPYQCEMAIEVPHFSHLTGSPFGLQTAPSPGFGFAKPIRSPPQWCPCWSLDQAKRHWFRRGTKKRARRIREKLLSNELQDTRHSDRDGRRQIFNCAVSSRGAVCARQLATKRGRKEEEKKKRKKEQEKEKRKKARRTGWPRLCKSPSRHEREPTRRKGATNWL